MENKTKAMQVFEQFATDRLNNHLAELNTRYEIELENKKQFFNQLTNNKL